MALRALPPYQPETAAQSIGKRRFQMAADIERQRQAMLRLRIREVEALEKLAGINRKNR